MHGCKYLCMKYNMYGHNVTLPLSNTSRFVNHSDYNMFTPLTPVSKLGSQVVNGRAIDVFTHRMGITHRGIILSVLISVLSPHRFTLCPPPTHAMSRTARAIVEMSSATFACILTGRDEVDA